MSGQNYLESNFINNYGDAADDFDCVGKLGSPSMKLNFHVFFAIGAFIAFSIMLYLSKPKKDKVTKKRGSRNTTQVILLIIGLVFLVISLLNGGYYIYLYLSCYVPQKDKWFRTLPEKARNMISQIEFNQETERRLERMEARQSSFERQQLNNNRQNNQSNVVKLEF